MYRRYRRDHISITKFRTAVHRLVSVTTFRGLPGRFNWSVGQFILMCLLSFSTWLTSTLVWIPNEKFNYRCENWWNIITSLNNFGKKGNSKLLLHNIHITCFVIIINNLTRVYVHVYTCVYVCCSINRLVSIYLRLWATSPHFLEFCTMSWLRISQVDMISFRVELTS